MDHQQPPIRRENSAIRGSPSPSGREYTLNPSIDHPGLVDVIHLPSGYFPNSSPWKDSPFLIGKPSISIRAIYTMAMLINRGYV